MIMEILDLIDMKIIAALQTNCSIPKTTLSKLAGVGYNTLARRIEMLEDRGVITGYKAIIDRKKMGYEPPQVCWRLYFFSYAATGRLSRLA